MPAGVRATLRARIHASPDGVRLIRTAGLVVPDWAAPRPRMDANSGDLLGRLYCGERPCLPPLDDEQASEGLMSAMGGKRTLASGRNNPQLDNPDIFRWLASDSGPRNLSKWLAPSLESGIRGFV
jgi:hypothetical protein